MLFHDNALTIVRLAGFSDFKPVIRGAQCCTLMLSVYLSAPCEEVFIEMMIPNLLLHTRRVLFHDDALTIVRLAGFSDFKMGDLGVFHISSHSLQRPSIISASLCSLRCVEVNTFCCHVRRSAGLLRCFPSLPSVSSPVPALPKIASSFVFSLVPRIRCPPRISCSCDAGGGTWYF